MGVAVDTHFMQEALLLAEQAVYISRPNPRVGCVIVANGQIVGRGYTQIPGQQHAEIQAIQNAQESGFESFTESTFYVTLEPCSHYGRTPPCVERLLALSPKRVVIAMRDPNPLVSGQGIERLKQAGIEVTLGVCCAQALALNIGFVQRMVVGLPWVRWKVASSIDGRTALNNGVSKWITGPQARKDSHNLRARSCAILTGVGTILADDPQLNVRDIDTPKPPAIYIVDSTLRTPLQAIVLQNREVHLLTTKLADAAQIRALEKRGAHVHILAQQADTNRVSLDACMQLLAQHAINEVHLECGSVLAGAMFQQGLIQEMIHYVAPILLGAGRGLLELPELKAIPPDRNFEVQEVRVLPDGESSGRDIRIDYRHQPSWFRCIQAVEE